MDAYEADGGDWPGVAIDKTRKQSSIVRGLWPPKAVQRSEFQSNTLRVLSPSSAASLLAP